MGRVRGTSLSVDEQTELWTRWTWANPRLTSGAPSATAGGPSDTWWRGGIAPPPRRRSRVALCAGERADISRGLARGDSCGRSAAARPVTFFDEAPWITALRCFAVAPAHGFRASHIQSSGNESGITSTSEPIPLRHSARSSSFEARISGSSKSASSNK